MITPIKTALDQYNQRVGGFKPNPIFYQKVGINHKRFFQLVRGDKEPMTTEIKNLSQFFNIPVSELIE